jgi:dihydrofolate reductase
MISIICAMDEKRGIGKDGEIPWHISEDFARVKKLTMGHPLIMGRRTFESIGRILPGRTNIIITQNSKFKIKNLASQEDALRSYVVNSLEEAIEVAKKSPRNDEIFIFGGGQIFKEAMEKNLVSRLYLTIVQAHLDSPLESPARQGDFNADTFFPDYSEFNKLISEEALDNGEHKYKFIELEK